MVQSRHDPPKKKKKNVFPFRVDAPDPPDVTPPVEDSKDALKAGQEFFDKYVKWGPPDTTRTMNPYEFIEFWEKFKVLLDEYGYQFYVSNPTVELRVGGNVTRQQAKALFGIESK